MRRTTHFLLATAILAAPMPVAAQVSVDLNALSGLGAAPLPGPPPSAPMTPRHYHHRMRHLARGEKARGTAAPTAVASATEAPATGPEAIEHPANLGPSFNSLPALPGAAPPVPAPPPAVPPAPPMHAAATKPAAPRPAETASATPKSATPKSATPKSAMPKSGTPEPAAPATPALALPKAVPPPPALAPSAPTRLAEATPPPPAAEPAPPKPAPNALPTGADRLTLPFFVNESDLPPAENAMLRDFAQRYGGTAEYVIRAFATPPAGDDDPSTPRRLALARAQAVAAALETSGVQPERVRLLALGNAGGSPADRVEVIAMPPSSSHTTSESTP